MFDKILHNLMKIKYTVFIFTFMLLLNSINANSQFLIHYGSGQVDKIAGIEVDSYDNPVVFISSGEGAGIDASGTTKLHSTGKNVAALVKYDEYGGLLWYKQFSFTGLTVVPQSITIDGLDNIYVAGYFVSDGGSSLNVSFGLGADWTVKSKTASFIVKYDSLGNLLWSKVISADASVKNIEILDIKADFDGNLLVAGTLDSSAEFNPGGSALKAGVSNQFGVFLAKYDDLGTGVFAYTYETNGKTAEDASAAVNFDDSDGFLLAGNFSGQTVFSQSGSATKQSKGKSDIFLARFNSSNALDWVISMGGANDDKLAPGGMDYTFFGDILLSGYFSGTANFDPQGKYELTAQPGFNAGFFASYNNFGQFNSAQMFYSETGKVNVARAKGNFLGDYIIAGSFTGNLKQNSSDELNLQSYSVNSGYDAFILNYTEFGTIDFAENFGSTETQTQVPVVNSISRLGIDSKSNIIAGGEFIGSKFKLADSVIQTNTSNDAFLVKLDSKGNLWTTQAVPDAPMLIYPENNAVDIDTALTLRWNPSAGATKYTVKLSKESSPSDLLVNESTAETSYGVIGLEQKTSYIWNVSSLNDNNQGTSSQTFKFTTHKITSVDEYQNMDKAAYLSNGNIIVNSDEFPYSIMVYNVTGTLLYSKENTYSNVFEIAIDKNIICKNIFVRIRTSKGDKIFKLINQ